MKKTKPIADIRIVKLKISDIIKLDWFKVVHRNNSPFFSSLIRKGSVSWNPNFEFKNTIKHQAMLDRDAYVIKSDFGKLVSGMVELAEKDKKFLDRYFSLVQSDYDNFLSFARKNRGKKWKGASSEELLETYRAFINLALTNTTHMWPPLGPEEWLVDEIQESLEKKIDDSELVTKVLNGLIYPEEISMIQELKESILRLASKFKKISSDELMRTFKKELWKYAWISDDNVRLDYKTPASFKKEIEEVLKKDSKQELKEIKAERRAALRQRDRLIKQYKLNKRIVHLCSQASKLPYVRNLRREAISQALFLMRDYFKVLSERIGIDNFTKCFYWEIEKALIGNKVDKKVNNRSKGFGLVIIKDTAYSMDVAEARKIKGKIEKPVEDVLEIKGSVACLGFVEGKVRVLSLANESNKMQEGEILVTSMTTPDFISAMKKAKGIITDEGGISCHAAIVSRELKKPCIIGTKIATKVLKDGDLVQIDANKGIVKILKKA